MAAGGDATLQMKNVFKTLKALAGDNEKIFVILDDRDDVWKDENKMVPINLLKIPDYSFFHHTPHGGGDEHFRKMYFNIANKYDLDLTLLTFQTFLLDVHTRFFRGFEKKRKIEKLTDVRHYIGMCK